MAKRKKLTSFNRALNLERPSPVEPRQAGAFHDHRGQSPADGLTGSGQSGLNIRVFVGLSLLANDWHLPDRAGFLLNDILHPQLPQP